MMIFMPKCPQEFHITQINHDTGFFVSQNSIVETNMLKSDSTRYREWNHFYFLVTMKHQAYIIVVQVTISNTVIEWNYVNRHSGR